MQLIPRQVEELLKIDEHVKDIAAVYKDAPNCLYLGRGFNFPVALEGALKLKEISYIHAEGYPAAEMKHGPIALIDENMPIFVIATNRGHYEKVVSNIQEIKSRKTAGQINNILFLSILLYNIVRYIRFNKNSIKPNTEMGKYYYYLIHLFLVLYIVDVLYPVQKK